MNFSWLTTRKVCSVIAHKSKLGGHRVVEKIWCPKNPSFLLSTVCCSVSSSSIPISMRTLSLVHDILCIFLHIHISHALIFFPFSLSLSTSHSHTELLEKLMFSLSFFVSMLTCLSCNNFSNPIIVAFPIATLRFISLSHLPSFSTSDPRNVKLDTTSYKVN